MTARKLYWLAVVLGMLVCQGATQADAVDSRGGDMGAGHIIGVGGIFFKSKNPKQLAAWYRDVLGLKIEDWGGATLSYTAPQHPPVVVWSPFAETTDYMTPSTREFMVNFAVDDLDAFVAKLAAKQVTILKRDETDPNGKFAWILDPDGTKIELWQPKEP